MLRLSTPAGQSELVNAVAVPITSREAQPPQLGAVEKPAKGTLAMALAPKHRTELLEEAS